MCFWPNALMSLLPVPPASIMSSFNIMTRLSPSLTLPERARRLSSNLRDGEDFNAVIRHLPFFFYLSVSVCCTQSSRRLCHPANVHRLIFFILSLSLSLNSHSVKAQTIWKIKCRLALLPPGLPPFLSPILRSPTCLLEGPEGIVGV